MLQTSRSFTLAVSRTSTIVLLALAQPAFADDPAKPDAAGAPAPPVEATPADAEDASPAPASSAVAEQAPPETTAPASRYPRDVVSRPLTLPSGLAMLGADAIANHDFSAMLAAPIVGYGITDKLEVQVPYVFATRELEAKGILGIDVGYALARGALGGKLEAIARVRGGYNTLASDPTPLMVGLHVQYNVTPKLAVISGVPGTQQLRISLADDAAMAKPVDFSVPLGIGVQPTPELYLQLDTKLAQIDIKDSANVLIGADATPVSLTAVYNVIHALDVQAAIGTDLSNEPGDALTFLIGARYYAGQL